MIKLLSFKSGNTVALKKKQLLNLFFPVGEHSAKLNSSRISSFVKIFENNLSSSCFQLQIGDIANTSPSILLDITPHLHEIISALEK